MTTSSSSQKLHPWLEMKRKPLLCSCTLSICREHRWKCMSREYKSQRHNRVDDSITRTPHGAKIPDKSSEPPATSIDLQCDMYKTNMLHIFRSCKQCPSLINMKSHQHNPKHISYRTHWHGIGSVNRSATC